MTVIMLMGHKGQNIFMDHVFDVQFRNGSMWKLKTYISYIESGAKRFILMLSC